ncbi:hypothetical protein ACLOJK_034880 [Asimina triloba]
MMGPTATSAYGCCCVDACGCGCLACSAAWALGRHHDLMRRMAPHHPLRARSAAWPLSGPRRDHASFPLLFFITPTSRNEKRPLPFLIANAIVAGSPTREACSTSPHASPREFTTVLQ